MPRWTAWMMAVVALGLPTGLWVQGDDRKPDEAPPAKVQTPAEHDRWMQIKLASSQQILAALTSGDMRDVERNARRIQVFNLLEQWAKDNPTTRQSDYRGQLNAFEYATKELVRYSQDGDTNGALEAYVNMTRSCVKCHELIRDKAPAR